MTSARRRQILLCAAELFSERGVAATTVRDIAQKVGILSGSLYHYFPSKDAIAFEIVISFIDDLNDRYAEIMHGRTPREALDEMVAASFETAVHHPYATEIYQNESLVLGEEDRARLNAAVVTANRCWEQAVLDGVQRGEFRADVDADQAHRILRETVWSSVRFNRARLSSHAEQLRHDIVAIFMDGFVTSSDDKR